jgi:hypothetical protein
MSSRRMSYRRSCILSLLVCSNLSVKVEENPENDPLENDFFKFSWEGSFRDYTTTQSSL